MKYSVLRTREFDIWLASETLKSRAQIAARISKIELEGHFGTRKDVGDFVFELKWENGRRIYYAYLEKENILLLLGGNKNGQSQDITQAKKILRKYTENED